MSRRDERSPRHRQLRVGEELRHALAAILERGEVRDPRLGTTPITVTEIRVSSDLRNATIFVTPLGGGGSDEVVEALNHAKAFLRGRLAAAVKLRGAPILSFVADGTFDAAEHIETLLGDPKVARDLTADTTGESDDGS
jgi:ribosome-binding factor A